MDRNEIFSPTFDGLKEKLGDLGLSTSGCKTTLRDRPMEYFGLTMSDGSEADAEKTGYQQRVRKIRVYHSWVGFRIAFPGVKIDPDQEYIFCITHHRIMVPEYGV